MSSELILYLKKKSTQKKLMHLFATQKQYSNIIVIFAHISALFLAPFIAIQLTQILPILAPLLIIISLIISGTQMRALGNILHECAHNSFFTKRLWNKKLGQFIAILEFSSFEKYQRQHLSHHLYLGDEHKDLDFAVRKKLNFSAPLTRGNLFIHILTIFKPQFYSLYIDIKLFDKHESTSLKMLRVLWIAFLILILFLFGIKFLFLFFVIPFLTTYQWMKFFSDLADHAEVISANQNELRSRNHIFKSQWLNLFLFPRNDSYHLVHHLFPVVPTWNLRDAHSILLENKFYAQLNHGMTKTLKQDSDL